MNTTESKPTTWMSDEAWLEARRKVLTATDAGAILGVHPWKSALQVYVEKTQGVELSTVNRRMRLGQRLEAVTADEYADASGRRVSFPPERLTLHPSIPWMAASLDRLQEDDVRGPGILEAKAVWHRLEEDEPLPAHWLVQVAHQMEVTQLPWSTIAALVFGEHLEWHDVTVDERFRTLLLERLEDFWRRLQRAQPPDPDASESSSKALRSLFPTAIEQTLTLAPDADAWASQYLASSTEITRHKKLKTEAQNRLMAAMGPASVAETHSGARFTYRVQRSGKYGKDTRVFRASSTKKSLPTPASSIALPEASPTSL